MVDSFLFFFFTYPAIMKFVVVSSALLAVLAFLLHESEAIFTGGVTITAGSLLVAALGVKAIAGFGLLLASGGRRRGGGGKSRGGYHKRSLAGPEDIPAVLSEAALEDEGDCAKKFVCEVHAKAFDALDDAEKAVFFLFSGANDSIDVSRESVQFDLAALVGRRAGAEQCRRVYARCEASSDDMKAVLRR